MPTLICAAENPSDRNNNHQHQPLTPRQARALVAALSRKAEEAIALDMVADYLELHPATPTIVTTQPTQPTACPSPDKKAGSTIHTTHLYRFDRSNLKPTFHSGYHFDTDAPRPFPFTVNHTTNN